MKALWILLLTSLAALGSTLPPATPGRPIPVMADPTTGVLKTPTNLVGTFAGDGSGLTNTRGMSIAAGTNVAAVTNGGTLVTIHNPTPNRDGIGTDSTNITAMGNFANWLHTPNVPLRFVCLGDSLADDIYTWFEIPLRAAFGVGGGYSLAAQTSDFQCSPWTNGAASLTEEQRNSDWFLNHYEMTDDAGEIVYRAHSGLGLGRTNIWADTFSISYAQQVGGGAIEVLLSKDNGAYQSVKYIPTAGSGGGFVTNFTASDVALTPGYYCMKLKGDAIDPVTIIGAGLWHSSSNRVWTSLIQEGGVSMSDILAVPTNTLFRVLSNINPHVAFFCMDAENPQAGFETNLWQLEWIFTNVWPNCDVVYIGNPPSSRVDGADVVAHNAALKAHCGTYGRFYFDWYTPMRSWGYADGMGWMTDTIHPSRKGATYGGGLLWRELGIADNVLLSSLFQTNAFPDGGLHLLNTAQTNNLGLGTTTPKERLTVHGGAYDGYTHIGSVAAGYGSVWMGNASRACTWAEMAIGMSASDTLFLNTPTDKIAMSVGGNVKVWMGPTGGLSLGAWGGSDPGWGHLYATNINAATIALRTGATVDWVWTCTNATTGAGHWADGTTNNSVFVRTNVTTTLYGNTYIGPTLKWITNLVAGEVVDATLETQLFVTNATFTISGFSGLDDNYRMQPSLAVSNSSASTIYATNTPTTFLYGGATNVVAIGGGEMAYFNWDIWRGRTNGLTIGQQQ